MNKGLNALVLMTTGLVSEEEWKECYNTVEKELKVLETLKDLIGDVEIEQYNKKPNRYELKMCGKAFYINQEQYQALKDILY